MNARQAQDVAEAINAQVGYQEAEQVLRKRVRTAVKEGVPILYLADALGVSRSRIRVLAREPV